MARVTARPGRTPGGVPKLLAQTTSTPIPLGTFLPPVTGGVGVGGATIPVPTSLLVHCDGAPGSTTFTDSSPFNWPLTTNAPAQVTATAKIGTGAVNVSGSSAAAIDCSAVAVVQFDDDGPFTIEVWGYWTGTATGRQPLISRYDFSSDLDWSFGPDSDGSTFGFVYGATDGYQFVTASYTPPMSTWVHYAVDRDRTGTIRVYANGVVISSTATHTMTPYGNDHVVIGNVQNFNSAFPGYVDEVCICHGLARYGGAFTPPTLPFSATPTVLLTHADGAPGSTTFTDSSLLANVLTSHSVTTTATSKFGAGAMDFTASNAAYLDTGASRIFTLGAGQFTIEAWVYFTSAPGTNERVIVSQWLYDGGTPRYWQSWLLGMVSGNLSFYFSNTGYDDFHFGAAFTPTLNTWYHVAVDRDATSNIRLYLNGAVIASTNNGAAFQAVGQNCWIGNEGNLTSGFPGYIDEVRISRGAAVYAGAFTPPSAPFDPYPSTGPLTQDAQTLSAAGTVVTPITGVLGPADTTTTLLVHADGTAGSTTFTDSSSYAHTLTATSTTVNATSKFGSGAADFTSSSSAAIGTGNATGSNFGAGQFTVEAWCYFTANTASDIEILSQFGGGNIGWDFYYNGSTHTLYFLYSADGSSSLTVANSYTAPINTWVHLAVDRDASNTLRLYQNGVVLTSATVAVTFFASTATTLIGNDGFGDNFTGYLDEVRITKGSARYGGAFTPASQPFIINWITQAGQTLSAAGTVAAATITGTLSRTQDNQTLVSTGTVLVTGTLAVTEALDTVVAAAGLTVTGTLNATEALDTIAATAGPVVRGTLTATQANQTLTASGWATAVGTLSRTQADQTILATGVDVVAGSLIQNQAPQTLVATGVLTVRGTLAVTEANDTIVAAGSVVLPLLGTLNKTQDAQTLNASGLVSYPVIGNLSVNQATQTSVATGVVVVGAVLARTQADQTLNATATVAVRGSLTITQASQTLVSRASTGTFLSVGFIPSNEVLHPPGLGGTTDTTGLGLILSTASLPQPALVPGPVTIMSGFVLSGEVLFPPVTRTVGIVHSGFIPSSEIVYTPTLLVEDFLHPNFIPSGAQVFSPTVVAGAAGLPVDFILDTDALFTPIMGAALLPHPLPGVYSAAFDVPPVGRVR